MCGEIKHKTNLPACAVLTRDRFSVDSFLSFPSKQSHLVSQIPSLAFRPSYPNPSGFIQGPRAPSYELNYASGDESSLTNNMTVPSISSESELQIKPQNECQITHQNPSLVLEARNHGK